MQTNIDGYYEFVFEVRNIPSDEFSTIVAYGALCAGRLMATGPHGNSWSGTYEPVSQNVVFDVVIDHSSADPVPTLLDAHGQQVPDTANYRFELPLSEDDGTIMMGGAVIHGGVTFEVVLTRKGTF